MFHLPSLVNENLHAMSPYGFNLDDMPFVLSSPSGMRGMRSPAGYYRPWTTVVARNDTGSTIIADKDKFEVDLDVQQFAPEEITVKVSGKNIITVEGKHEEKQDEHGFISRHFVRKYTLPEGHDVSNVVSHLSLDGVLSIAAPRIKEGDDQHRHVPIHHTGVPKKAVHHTKKPEKHVVQK